MQLLSREAELELLEKVSDHLEKRLEIEKQHNDGWDLIARADLLNKLGISGTTLNNWEKYGLKPYQSPFENGKKIYPTLVYRIINSYFSAVTSKKDVSPHILRHSFASHLLDNGADLNTVKELLGHSSLASTQVYTNTSLVELKRQYKKAHPRANNSENEEETEKQIAKYDRIVSIFDSSSIKYRFRHIQASPLLFKYRKKYNYDFARVGMAIYGMEPLSKKIGLCPVLKLSSKIINIRKLSKGEKV